MYLENDRPIYLISEFFTPVIINDDRTALSDQEELELDAFLAAHGHHFTLVVNEYGDAIPYFTRCEVCNQLASCYEVTTC